MEVFHLKDEFWILKTPVLTGHLPASVSGSSGSPSVISSALNSPSFRRFHSRTVGSGLHACVFRTT